MDINRFKKPDDYKDWFDWWLSDEPPAPAARRELRQKRVERANEYQRRTTAIPPPEEAKPPAPTSVTININLAKLKLPKPKLPKVKLPALPYKRLAYGFMALAVVAYGGLAAYHWQRQHAQKSAAASAGHVSAQPLRQAPSFTPAAPKNKPQLGAIGDSQTAYDGSRDSFSFIDSLNGNQLTVSQQPLPGGSGTPQQAVTKVASQIGAAHQIVFDNGVAYLDNNPKSNSQTVIFSVKGLLIFINSPFNHPDDAYKAYIESLE
jgi:hypothetical protein